MLLICLLLTHTFFLTFCAVRKSACFDEGAHLAAGCAYLKWGEFSIYNLSPPPLRCWAALPAYLAGARVPPAKPLLDHSPMARHWIYYSQFQSYNLPNVARYVLWGRLMLIPLSIAVALVIFLLSRSIYGESAGFVSCALWCLSPTVIADASTIGTDIGFVLGALIGLGWWWRFLQTGSTQKALICAGGMALACVSKFSAVALWPLLILMAIVAIWRRTLSLKIAVTGFSIVVILNYVVINSVYGYRHFGSPLYKFDFVSDQMRSISQRLPTRVPVPFPYDLVEGLDAQKWELEGKYTENLFGQTYFGSDWRYYPVLLATKLTPSEALLFILLLGSLFYIRLTFDEFPFALLTVSFFAYAEWGIEYNNGLRYLLPVMASAAILMGRLMRAPRLKPICIVAVTGALISCALATPRFHSYCNIFAADSGIEIPDRDWGQSMLDLKRWMNRAHQAQITVVNFSATSPAVYGIDAVDPLGPVRTDYIAISRRFLSGMSSKSELTTYFVRPWRRLLQTKPVVDFGGIVVYRASEVQIPTEPHWIVEVRSLEESLNEPQLAPIRGISKRSTTE